MIRKEFPGLKECCCNHLWAPSCYHRSVDTGWNVIERYIQARYNLYGVYTMTSQKEGGITNG